MKTAKLNSRLFLFLSLLTGGLTAYPARSGEVSVPKSPTIQQTRTLPSIFDKGRWELQSGSGAYFSFSPDSSARPELDYSLSTLRLGIMLSDVGGEGFLRGNTELLLEGFVGSVLEGAGDYLGGATVLLRYNFVRPATSWVPYVQLGAGGFYSDIYKDRSQNLIGQALEFNLQAAAGVRYILSQRWAIALEGGYHRVSQASNSERNRGLDSLGGQIGFCRFF